MALPTIETPRYELTLPSQDIQVQYRTFLVKEEKILLMAMESKDNNQIITATKDIINACTFTSDKLISTSAAVCLSSGQTTLKLAISPTDLPLICSNRYSISNIGNLSISSL